MSEYAFPNEPPLMDEAHFERLMIHAHQSNASDVTLQTNERVIFHMAGKIIPVTERALTDYEIETAVRSMYGGNGVARLKGGDDIDISVAINVDYGVSIRFRVNMTACYSRGADGIQITARIISANPPSLEYLRVPDEIIKAAYPEEGLVLVCGGTGSGKTSLIAGLLAHRISQPDINIKLLTAEAPIEYVFDGVPRSSASVCQSEVPVHLNGGFAAAVRNALRRAPDYILIGESRDQETIAATIEASETGHTVYSTVHSDSVHNTLYRLINYFRPEERGIKMHEIIESLRLVVVQKLIPKIGGGRVAAREYLEFTEELRDMLRATPTVREAISMTKRFVQERGKTMASAVRELVNEGLIDERYAGFIESKERAEGVTGE